MSSTSQYYTIKIERNAYSYGFELKDEGRPYKKYAIVSKITNNVTNMGGLKVGDKIVSINGDRVDGKDYISLRNIIRKSLDNCVTLEILKEMDFQLLSPGVSSPQVKLTPMKLTFGKTLIPTGSTREKISLFQNSPKKNSKKCIAVLSNSCDCIHKCGSNNHTSDKSGASSLSRAPSLSVNNLAHKAQSSDSELEIDINQTISQDPFMDDSIFISQDFVQIQLPSSAVRVIDTKSTEHIETQLSLTSHDTVFEQIPDSFDDKHVFNQEIAKLQMPNFPSSYSIPSGFDQLSPEFINTKSRSSNNIFEDGKCSTIGHYLNVTVGWTAKAHDIKNCAEFGSMTDINSSNKKTFFNDKKLPRQQSLIANIPIKLRIVQFHDKIKSKTWKDYVIGSEPTGTRFRQRHHEIPKGDRTINFIIRLEDINKFEVDSPHRRHKTSPGSDIGTSESLLKYNLMAFNSRVQIKFHFNPTIFQDEESSNRAFAIYKDIINSFKAADSRCSNIINNQILSKSNNANLSLFDNQKTSTLVKESNSSIDEMVNVDHHNSSTNSYKSKSSAENISEMSQSSTKNIFKQAIGKIKPEKKIKITQTYQVFTGTKAEFEEFQKQLEGGHLPLELDSSDENGINFNRYIYEVPRMNKNPKIPMIIYLCTELVEKYGLKVEGIYRISGNQRVIRTLSNALNGSLDEIETNLPEWKNIHAVCGVLKLFLRKLKQYLIPADLSHVLAYSCKAVDCEDPRSLSKTLMDIRYHLSSYQIPSRCRSNNNILDQVDCRWESLQYLLKHLSKVVSYRKHNSMDEHAISICFNPVIMESWQNNINDIKADNEIMVKALELILVHQDWLFCNWKSEMDCSWSSELVENAEKYATTFIDGKYDFNIKLSDEEECVDIGDIAVNLLVQEIVSQSTTTFGEKKILERRHSSHTPGQKSVVLRDNVDKPDSGGMRRNSQTTEALDLVSSANWMKKFVKVATIEESREIKMTYIPSTEPHSDTFEPCIPDGRVLTRQVPLATPRGRNAVDYGVRIKDPVTHSSQKSDKIDLETL